MKRGSTLPHCDTSLSKAGVDVPEEKGDVQKAKENLLAPI